MYKIERHVSQSNESSVETKIKIIRKLKKSVIKSVFKSVFKSFVKSVAKSVVKSAVNHTIAILVWDWGNHQTVLYRLRYCVTIDITNTSIVCDSNSNSFSDISFGKFTCFGDIDALLVSLLKTIQNLNQINLKFVIICSHLSLEYVF